MKLEELIQDLEPNERVAICDVWIAMNLQARRERYHCDRFSMINAMQVIEDALKRGVLWGTVEAAMRVTNT